MRETAGFKSVESWAEDHRITIDAEHLLQLRTRLGRKKSRWDSLNEAGRHACLERVNARLSTMDPESFVAQTRIVYGSAVRPR